ncbi:DUF1254 domain-containing protein [Arthrobacter sp. YAF34]|uniref:DUF1254 domain-containing protein n=1 Tax=Arthrobacter sp. YAF34 TaxID=3233083 RepID=UPI003F8F05F5
MKPLLTGRVEDWRAAYAYTAGMQAFIYGFPYIYNARLRHEWVTNPRDPEVVPYAAVNHFWHAGRLLDASYRDGGCPNNDTLYSLAWLGLREGPVVLSHPGMGERYFTFEIMGFTSDNVGYVGQRTTGSGAGNFAIIGLGWHGTLPDNVRSTQPSPTPWVLLLGRTLVTGPEDLPAARSLQSQYRLTPLHLWGQAGAKVPEHRDVYAPTPPTEDPYASGKPATVPPRCPARAVRPYRHRPRPRRRRPAEVGATGPCRRRRHGPVAPAFPQRRLGHQHQRLAHR